MQIITNHDIKSLAIQPETCLQWVEEALLQKEECKLPPKTPIKWGHDIFATSMPSLIPSEGKYGLKVVTRFPERIPALDSQILLYDSETGTPLAIMDGNWITAMRTGAVAALSINHLKKTDCKSIGFIGLGNTARTTMLMLAGQMGGVKINLLKYKNQAELFIERFSKSDLEYAIYNDVESLIKDSDVVVSCVTAADNLICPNNDCFKEGVLVVPVHTPGFQNCDLFFDKVFGDDTGHVRGFKYFDKFKKYDEFVNVLSGNNPGRENDKERILAYNVGISLHDIFFASKIYNLLKDKTCEIDLGAETEKFWI